MIHLNENTSLELVLGDSVATNQLHITADYGDVSSNGRQINAVNGDTGISDDTTPVDIVSSPDEGAIRKITFVSIYNADTAPVDVIVQKNDGTNTRIIYKSSLKEDRSLQYSSGRGWFIEEDGIILGDLAIKDTVDTDDIENEAVTLNKLADISPDVILGRDEAGDGPVLELTPVDIRTLIDVEEFADVTDETNVQAALAADAAGGRSALNLGTAAITNVTTSETDSTSGRVTRTGDGGLLIAIGDDQPTWPNTSLDDCSGVPSGIYRTTGSSTDMPPGFNTNNVIYFANRFGDGNQYTQLVINLDGSYAVRGSIGTGSAASPNWGDWKIFFSTGNILGNVSESGGTPTGAIIERGSNSNGEYVRFADGTQICTHKLTTSTATDANGAGTYSDPYYTDSFDWNFPSSFISAPRVNMTHSNNNGGQTIAERLNVAIPFDVTSSTASAIRVYNLTGASNGTIIELECIAIGRWF